MAKVKANASQGLPEMIEIANSKRFTENYKQKHNKDAENGWYRYDTQFALPIHDNEGRIERFNVYHAVLVVRHDRNDKLYLYDLINIKKKRQSRPPK